MAEYFDICGTHIPISAIKDFRTIKVEFVFRPVFRESKKTMMTALSGKKYEFAYMEPYAAIIGQQGHKSELGEYKAKDFKEALGKDISGAVIYTIADALKLKAFKRQRYQCVNLAGRAFTTYLDDVPVGGWTDEHKTTKLVLRLIEPGSFKMGGSCDVTLTKPYYMGVFEVTQRQYELVTGNKPSKRSGNTLPVEQVSWNMIRGDSATHNWPTVKTVDSNSFVGRLQARTGLNLDTALLTLRRVNQNIKLQFVHNFALSLYLKSHLKKQQLLVLIRLFQTTQQSVLW
jgi:hypothetical protein